MPSTPLLRVSILSLFHTLLLTSSQTDPHSRTFLLGTILENMTLGANPTFICKDRSGTSFAVSIQLSGKGEGKFPHMKGFKKGYTIVVRGARRFGVKDGKQGSVRVGVEGVEVCFSFSLIVWVNDKCDR
jgi:hypothetical protein